MANEPKPISWDPEKLLTWFPFASRIERLLFIEGSCPRNRRAARMPSHLRRVELLLETDRNKT